MLKNKPDKGTEVEAILKGLSDLHERLDDLEKRKDADGSARLLIAERLFNTDRSHLRELTYIPIRAVRQLALADTVGSILHPAVQSGMVTLGEIWRESHHRYMRSVKGSLISMGKELAMEQTRTTESEEPYDEGHLGKGM